MIRGAIGHLDVAQVVLYAFFAFFAGLIWYLRQEDRREGYPLESEVGGSIKPKPFLFIPAPKTFRLADGSKVQAPSFKADERPVNARKTEPWPGAPLEPIGDALTAGVGPGSYAERPETAAKTVDGHDLVSPLRVATNFAVAPESGNPLGYSVIGADRRSAGKVKDVWVDRTESLVRYYEIDLESGRSILAPVHFCDVDARTKSIRIKALESQQFAKGPVLANPDSVTMQEEDKIAAFFGAGTLYSSAARSEPLL